MVDLVKLKARQERQSAKAEAEANKASQLEAKIKAAEKKLHDAKAYALGRAALAEMEMNTSLAKTMRGVLERGLKLPRERELFGLKPVEVKPESANEQTA